MDDVKKFISENGLGEISENMSFKDCTTLKVGGKISLFYYPNTVENFLIFHDYFRPSGRPLFIIGSGSNVFAADDDFEGVVVSFKKLPIKYYRVGNIYTCYPGCSVVRLSHDLAKAGFAGGEFLAGIPATVGGAVYMNAGANGSEIKDVLISAKLLDRNGEVREYKNFELGFGYRKTRLQDEGLIVLEAKFKFNPEKPEKVLKRVRELKKQRSATQPVEQKCAGCTFQNPPGKKAWELIDAIGFRRYKINRAQVSEKHCNFLINNGGATSKDFLELIEKIKEKVKNKFGIDLKCEWVLVNFDNISPF